MVRPVSQQRLGGGFPEPGAGAAPGAEECGPGGGAPTTGSPAGRPATGPHGDVERAPGGTVDVTMLMPLCPGPETPPRPTPIPGALSGWAAGQAIVGSVEGGLCGALIGGVLGDEVAR